MDQVIGIVDVLARETMLFAATGLLIGGIDDAMVDATFLVRRLLRLDRGRIELQALPEPTVDGTMVIFVAAWDEVAVIGAMLATALANIDHGNYRIYVGLYPNDGPTIDAAGAVAATDARIRLVIGDVPGPTTKAGCLNTLWQALQRDIAAGLVVKAVILHDAEDVVHRGELAAFDTLIEGHAVVQLPVLPLIRRGSAISAHYADEFAYAHTVQQVVRSRIGAAMPLAGTGCAIALPVLARIAADRGGAPFDATSLTEDYELGLRIGEDGGSALFARIVDTRDGSLVAVRAYFPDRLIAATRQKARWMTGIALAGWDRTGWARAGAIGDHWMRMRDRRGPLSVVVLAVAYCAAVLWASASALHWIVEAPPIEDRLADWLLDATFGLLLWRLFTRAACTARSYGWREGVRSAPRFLVSNFVALVAGPQALGRYLRLLRGGALVWDKTRHDFPETPAADPA